jgi:hypothetical protein
MKSKTTRMELIFLRESSGEANFQVKEDLDRMENAPIEWDGDERS